MGNIIRKKNTKASTKASISVSKIQALKTKKIVHKANVLTLSDVEANRCRAYSYLSL